MSPNLEDSVACKKALLTHSCTGALEMAALLLNVSAGDEIIMPSFTFVSTANAFALRGAKPVFVDIKLSTLNIDENAIEAAITPRTKAIVVVHYAGVACEMDEIQALAAKHGLYIVEDAAQGLGAFYKGRPLGSIGDIAATSFHETKNISCGEGGALFINREEMADAAEIAWEKGTDRSKFSRGVVDKYTWKSLGSSYLPGELNAAFLLAQLEAYTEITKRRIQTWNHYHNAFTELAKVGLITLPKVYSDRSHNGHIFYLVLDDY